MKKTVLIFILAFLEISFLLNAKDNTITFEEMKKTINYQNYYLEKGDGKGGIKDIQPIVLVTEKDLAYSAHRLDREENDNYTAFYRHVKDVTASSQLSKDYEAQNVFNQYSSIPWCEGVQGYGRMQWVKIRSKTTFQQENKYGRGFWANYLVIHPGNGRSDELFKSNNRLKTLVVKVYNSHVIRDWGDAELKQDKMIILFRLHFKDENKLHVFPVFSDYLAASTENSEYTYTFYIEDVYKGSKNDDTCIGDIAFMDKLVLPPLPGKKEVRVID
jgi:hypothetical protein